MRVADVVAKELLDFGIDRVFGIPGGENVEVVDALRRAGIRFVLVHHETSAVFMADATARLTGRPAACLTTLGPGASNAAAGVAHAYLDRAPVLVITAQMPADLIPRQPHQYVDLAALFAPITKASIPLASAGAAETVRRALQLTRSGKPGPVHLQVANDVAGEDAAARDDTAAARVGAEPPSLRSGDLRPARPAPSDLEAQMPAALELIARSRRPAIVAGLGLEGKQAFEALRRLAEAAGAPVISTPKAKGCLPDDHPLAGGTIGLLRTDPPYRILDEADCIVAVGLDPVELVRPWDQAAPLIWVAPWENRAPVLPAQAELVGPVAPALERLCRAAWRTAPDWGESRVRTQREELERVVLPAAEAGRVLPQTVIAALQDAAPRDAIVTTDVGSHKILTSLTWRSYTPNSFLLSNGLSCMGYGLPAAIAASLVDPSRQVICITGDAGLAMALGELAVLARVGRRVLVVVLNDEALDLIRSQQARAGKPPYGTEFTNPDFVRIAEAYGLAASRVGERVELSREVQAAFARVGPTLLEVMIDPVGYPTTLKTFVPT